MPTTELQQQNDKNDLVYTDPVVATGGGIVRREKEELEVRKRVPERSQRMDQKSQERKKVWLSRSM